MNRANTPRHGRKPIPMRPLHAALFVAALTVPVTAFAQAPASVPTSPAGQGVASVTALTPPTLSPQPTGKTPSTPLPKDTPPTKTYGIGKEDVQKTTTFANAIPGQPLPTDPPAIRTLEDALLTAYRRNPTLLTAYERAIKTTEGVKQLLAVESPSISGSLSYTRLANPGSTSAIGSGGVSPSQIQNPFGVGLNYTPPGSAPVTLSTSSVTSGNSSFNASASGSASGGNSATGSGSNSVSSGSSRAVSPELSRQNSGGTTNKTAPSVNLNVITPRIQAAWFIDVTGIVRTARQLGDLEQALSRLEIARTRQDITLQVRNAYYNLLRSIAFVSVNEAAVAQSTELVRVTQVQKDNGVASQYDVLRARTQLQNNQQALITSRNQVNIAKNALANQIGVDPSTLIDPAAPASPAAPNLNEDNLITSAFTQRPEYAQADINLLVADKNIRLARRGLEPYVNVNAAAGYNVTGVNAYDRRDAASVGATLSIPFSDGGATRHAIESARSDKRTAEITKDQFVRGIKAEVQEAIIAVRDAQERGAAAEVSVTEAREAFRLAGVRFRAGVGTQLDVNDAQTALIQAETNRVNAQYDYLGSLARLSRAIGVPE